jgi:oligosaccharide reducing-end xylanase
MTKLMLLTLGLMVSIAQWASGATGTTTVCKWKDNKTAAWTMSVDDNCASDVPFVLSALNSKGIKMTWYLVTGTIVNPPQSSFGGTWDLWRSVAVQGHELGSHTVTHNSLTTLSAAGIDTELSKSKAKLEQEVPANGKVLSMAYPSGCNDTTVRTLVADYYIVGRGVTGGTNSASPSINPLDGRNLCNGNDGGAGSMFDLVTNSGHATSAVDAVLASGGWLADEYHQINDNGGYSCPTATFSTLADYIYGKRAVLWSGSTREVAQYVYERNASAVQVVSADQSQIVLNLTYALDTTVCVFGFPLTMKTEVAAAWDTVTVTQAGSRTVVRALTEATKKYVYFDARPNHGQIILASAGATAVRPLPALAAGPQQLQTNRARLVHNLHGEQIDYKNIRQTGIYLVEEAGEKILRKILVIR